EDRAAVGRNIVLFGVGGTGDHKDLFHRPAQKVKKVAFLPDRADQTADENIIGDQRHRHHQRNEDRRHDKKAVSGTAAVPQDIKIIVGVAEDVFHALVQLELDGIQIEGLVVVDLLGGAIIGGGIVHHLVLGFLHRGKLLTQGVHI